MPALSFDCSSQRISVAITERETVLSEHIIESSKNHAAMLMPLIEKVCADCNAEIAQMDFFAFTIGPGSFTSLRIAAATAKGFALALDKPLIGISALEALALNVKLVGWTPYTNKIKDKHNSLVHTICPLIDARDGLVYSALYQVECNSCNEMKTVDKPNLLVHTVHPTIKEIRSAQLLHIEKVLNEITGKTIFLGDGARINHDTIANRLEGNAIFIEPELDLIKASPVGIHAYGIFTRKEFLNPLAFTPIYLQRPAVERA